MQLKTVKIYVDTKGNTDIVDITESIENKLKESSFIEGNVLVFVVGSTAGITTIEYEPGLIKDYPAFLERIIPRNIRYFHDETWHDGNGHSHVKAALQGGSLTIPFTAGKLLLGTWQQIILIDFDNRPRKREIIIQISGIKPDYE